jgi:hypothetical protein
VRGPLRAATKKEPIREFDLTEEIETEKFASPVALVMPGLVPGILAVADLLGFDVRLPRGLSGAP